MNPKLTLLPVLAVAGLAFAPRNAEGRGGNSLVRQAHHIDEIADHLRHEFDTHYRHSGAYRHLVSDVEDLHERVHHIDELAHDAHSSLRHIRSDLRSLDDLAHHLHELVDAVERGRYGGHVDGHTRHVHHELDALNDAIHRMERSVARMARSSGHGHGHEAHDRDRHGGHARDGRGGGRGRASGGRRAAPDAGDVFEAIIGRARRGPRGH